MALVLVSVAALAAAAAKEKPAELRGFWQITDVHVDLLKECSGSAPNWYGSFDGQYGCGCTVEALNATTAFMHKELREADFILFSGDATASGPILSNIELIQASIRQHFPDTPTFLILGNHDFPGSPVGEESAAWYHNVSEHWGSAWMDQPAAQLMATRGYYSQRLRLQTGITTPIRLVVLNTEYFNHGNSYVVQGDTIHAALEHLKWLNDTLASVEREGEVAYVIGHVPQGMETGYLNDQRVPSSARPYWMDIYAKKYQEIMDHWGEDVVRVQIFGHEHVDTFRLMATKTVALTAPSLSTAYPRTNPTVRLWRHNVSASPPPTPSVATDGAVAAHQALKPSVLDYDQFYMDLLESNAKHKPRFKRSYSFREEYSLPDLSRASFEKLLVSWQTDTSLVGRAGRQGWECSADAKVDAIYVANRSASSTDPSFPATKSDCARECNRRGRISKDANSTGKSCSYWQWGHTNDFNISHRPSRQLAWCFLWSECGALVKSTGATNTTPYEVSIRGGRSGKKELLSYNHSLRFFLSSTPLSIQPLCDSFCQVQDLCDKSLSAHTQTDGSFTQCVDTGGQQLIAQPTGLRSVTL